MLAGSHTWNNLVDMGPTDPPRVFDYEAIFMDPYDGTVLSRAKDLKRIELVRQALGHAQRLSRRVDLATLTPRAE